MPIENKYGKFILFSGLIIFTWCIWVIIHSHLLKTQVLLPEDFGHLPMAVDAAVCFILSAVTLLMLFRRVQSPLTTRVIKILSLAIITCGALSVLQDILLEYQINIPLINNLILEMSPQTAACFIVLGTAFYNAHNRKRKVFTQSLLHIITLFAFIVFLGHIYQVPGFYNLTYFPAMAIYSAIGFLLLSVGASFINPTIGITGIFTGDQIGHLMARKLFFLILFATLVAGYIRLLAHKHHFFEVEFGTALLIVVFCIISLVSVWLTTATLNKYEAKNRAAQENIEIILDSAPYSIIKTNGKGKIMLVNKQAERMFGYSREILVGEQLSILIPQRFHEIYHTRQKLVQESKEIMTFGRDEELYSHNKNGTEFPVEVIVCPLTIQDEPATLVTLIDVSHRKQNEKIIKDQLLELQSKNQELEHFNYISSHDMQEPLRTVLNYIDMIEEDYPEINPEVQMHLASVKSTVKRMSRIVKSLLDFGRLGRNKKMTLTNVGRLIENVKEDLQNMIQEADAIITVHGKMPEAYTYETELSQLFQNLISNAIKFRKPDISPEIEISCKKLKGFYQFTVSDNGIGIDPKYFDRIFNIFQRLNREEDYEGHGIGLANCKKIAEMHGGKIWVESEPGKGTAFIFTILNFTTQ